MEMGTSYKNSSEHKTNGYQELREKNTKQRAQQRREKGDTRKQTRMQTIDAPALRRLNEGGRGEGWMNRDNRGQMNVIPELTATMCMLLDEIYFPS
jgi:hypothetical protein